MTSKRESLAVRPGESVAVPEREDRAERMARRRVATPAVDILECGEGVKIRADIPGVPADGVEVSLDRDLLTIRARSRFEPPKGLQAVYREHEALDYERSFTLGRDIDRDAVTATVSLGVLEVFLPKAKAARARRVEVKTA